MWLLLIYLFLIVLLIKTTIRWKFRWFSIRFLILDDDHWNFWRNLRTKNSSGRIWACSLIIHKCCLGLLCLLQIVLFFVQDLYLSFTWEKEFQKPTSDLWTHLDILALGWRIQRVAPLWGSDAPNKARPQPSFAHHWHSSNIILHYHHDYICISLV